MFDIKDKIVIVTGGASGIGLSLIKEFLRNGVKGITVADINKTFTEKVIKEINEEFIGSEILFVQTNVAIYEKFKNVFIKTIERFGRIDILVNNAGIHQDGIWEQEVAVNLLGTTNGMILAINEYLPKYQHGPEAVIVNISSTSALEPSPHMPIYAGTKIASIAFAKNWGNPQIYKETKVRVITVCPGDTITDAYLEINVKDAQQTMSQMYENIRSKKVLDEEFDIQESDFVAKETIRAIKYAQNGTIWVVEGSKPIYQYILPDRKTMKNNIIIEQFLE